MKGENWHLTELVSTIDSSQPTGACLVAMTRKGKLLGTLGLRLSGPGGFINSLFVHEDARGLGVGKALLLRAIEVSRAHGKLTIGLTVHEANTVAQQLYRRLGFVPYENCTESYTEYIAFIGPAENPSDTKLTFSLAPSSTAS